MARTKPEKIPFSKRRLERLHAPETGRRYVYDERTPHLALAITPADSRAFYWYKSVGGRPVRYRIGSFPETTVEQARREATRLNAEAVEGGNPQARRRAKRGEATLGEIFDEYLERHAKPHKRTWQADDETFQRHLKPLADRRISTISREDVERLKTRIGGQKGDDRPYMANRVLALLSTIYNKAAPDTPNPTRGVQRFPEQSRDRHMTKDEIRHFFAALADEAPLWADFFSLGIFTGARRGNLFSMRWADVDLNTRRWTIPGRESKSGKAMPIPLSAAATEILRRRAAANGDSDFVFPSETSASGHIEDSRKAWARVVKRADLADLRIHDLRRSLASVMVAEGVPLVTIAKTLGHRDLKATAVYARLDFEPQLEAVEQAGRTIQGIVDDTAKALVEGEENPETRGAQ